MPYTDWMPVRFVPLEIPLGMLDETHAQRVHGCTLADLRDTGGMSVHELMCNLDGVGAGERRQRTDDLVALMGRVEAWHRRAA